MDLRSPRGAFAAAVLGLCLAVPFHSQAQSAPPAPARAASSPRPTDDDAEQARRKDRERTDRSSEQAAPQAFGDAPVPPEGEPTPKPRVTRGPLSIRRTEVSLGVDHALSKHWIASGLVGVSRGRLHRFQSEVVTNSPDEIPQTSDSTLHTRSTTLTAMASYLPAPDVFYDVALSVMRTSIDLERNVNDLALFRGDTTGRAWSLSASAGGVWRLPYGTLVPQAGLEYVAARVNPLATSFVFVDDPTPNPGFTVGEQRTRTLAGLLGAQMQWPRSASFGVWAPYARTTWRQRLWMSGDTIVASANGANDILTDPKDITPRSTATLAGGVLFQWPGGVGAFAEVAFTRASGDVHERRVSFGLKFEI